MDKLTSGQKIFIGVFTILVMIALRVATYFFKDIQVNDFVALGFAVLAALGATHMSQDKTPTADKPPGPQAGFAQFWMLMVVAAIASLLAGCAGFQQAVTGYEASATKGVQAANDNTIAVWKVLACATPLSAVLRNPEVIPALKALCLPGGNAYDPNGLLPEKK